MTDRGKKRKLEEYLASVTDDRPEERHECEGVALNSSDGRTAQSIPGGQGIQPRDGDFPVGRDPSFGKSFPCGRSIVMIINKLGRKYLYRPDDQS